MNSTSSKPTSGHSRQSSNVQTSKTHTRNLSFQRIPSSSNEQAIVDDSSDSVHGSEYDFVEREELNDTGAITDTPTYHFPSTWEAAKHDTTTALREVGTASSSYYYAIANSGIGSAGWSIGGALANTLNRTALTVAGKAVTAAGANHKLPRGVQNWLKGKEALDEAKWRAEEVKQERAARKKRREMIERGDLLEVEPGVYVDPRSRRGSMISGRGSMLNSEEGELRDGQRGHSRQASSSSNRLTADMSNFRISEGSEDEADDERSAAVPIKTALPHSNPNPWLGSCNNNSPNTPLLRIGRPVTLFASPGFDSIDTHVEPYPLETPAHAKGIFKDLETPTTVRRQLNAPFTLGVSPAHPALVGDKKEVESPYHQDEEDGDPYFRGKMPSLNLAARRRSSAIAKPRIPFDLEEAEKEDETKEEDQEAPKNDVKSKEDEEGGEVGGLFAAADGDSS